MMGLPDGQKMFKLWFSRFDTILAVTDNQPASHPASHVAVAKCRLLRRAGNKN